MDKRLVTRLAIVSGVLSLGGVGIWQAQRGEQEASAPEAAMVEASIEVPEASPDQAAPPVAETTASPAARNNPFSTPRLPSYGGEPSPWADRAAAKPINQLRGQGSSIDSEKANMLRGQTDAPSEGQAALNGADSVASENSGEPKPLPFGGKDPFGRHASSVEITSDQAPEAITVAAEEPVRGSPWANQSQSAAQVSDQGGAAQPDPANGLPASSRASSKKKDLGRLQGNAHPLRPEQADITPISAADAASSSATTAAALPAHDLQDQGPAPAGVSPFGAASAFANRGLPSNGTSQPQGVAASQEPAALQAGQPGMVPLKQSPVNGIAAHQFASSTPIGSATSFPRDGTGRPGNKQLEGAQTSQVTIQKSAPAEIQVGKPAKFTITVRNAGTAAAHGVEIHDEVPAGTRLLKTTPQANTAAGSGLVWTLGDLAPGESKTAELEVMPVEEGEIGSVATVVMRADASVRTISTRPQLALKVETAPQVLIGEQLTLRISISNTGTGAATGVMVQEYIPQGLTHTAGSELEFEVGQLGPGETRKLDLTLTAATAGQVSNRLIAHGDANLEVEEKTPIQIVAPELEIAMTGPNKRYLERQATYVVSVSNPGTASAKDIQLTTHLPSGFKFVKANNEGSYDPRQHSVTWSLEELPPSESGSVSLTAIPIEAGEQKLRTEGKAQRGLSDEQEQTVTVEGLAAIYFEVVDVEDPVEAGGETAYEIRVMNQGSKACTNVQVAMMLPQEMSPVAGDGPSACQVAGQEVLFQPLARLAPKADVTYRVRVKGISSGHHRVSVQVACTEIPEPVTKEESTRVYTDQ